MEKSADLPQPTAAQLAHSERLAAHIRDVIAASGGWIGFDEYMSLALYAPGLGYYSAGATKFGAAGDFVTAPETGSLFGRAVGRLCGQVLESIGGGTIVEIGAGRGSLAADILESLGAGTAAAHSFDRYLIVEVSADLRERQRRLLSSRVPQLLERVEWVAGLPERRLAGVLLANEVLDALPVERFAIQNGRPQSVGVSCDASGNFVDAMRPAMPSLADAIATLERDIGRPFAEGYASELCLRLPAWLKATTNMLDTGLALLIDYGGARREVYHQERRTGTLACHYRHRFHTNPFLWPGLQDISAWVDFSTVAAAGREAGLQLSGYGTQAHFLLARGVLAELAESPGGGTPERELQLAAEARRLLLPGEMGERFKAIAFTAGAYEAPQDLLVRDLQSML